MTLGRAVEGAVGLANSVNVGANNRQLDTNEYQKAKQYAKIVAQKLVISEQEAEGRIVAEMLRNADQQTAEASGGIHDYQVRSIIGCQNLNCNGSSNAPLYADHNANAQFIAPNQEAYHLGQTQAGTGQTYNQLVTNNIQNDPVGATLAGAGMAGLGVVTAGGIPSLGGMAFGGTIGGLANASMQAAFNSGSVNPVDVGMGTVTGALTFGTGLTPSLLMNLGGALAGSGIKGENPNLGMAGAAVGTTVGYGLGSVIETGLNKVVNPWYRPQWQDLGLGISVAVPRNPLPSVGGTGISAFGQEITGNTTTTIVNEKSGK